MSSFPQPDNSQALEAILSKVTEIAVLPQAVYKILELSGSNSSSTAELEKAIQVDPGFSTRLLAHANCAFYGLPKKVTSIHEAIMFIGFKQVRQMAMTVGFFDMFAGKNDKESLRRRAWWRDSLDSAIAAKWVAKETRKADADEAYTVGLLHLIGRTILDRSEPGAYDRVESLAASGLSACAAEASVYGCDHVDVGIGACKMWSLPDSIVEGLNYVESHRPTGSPNLAAVVAVGVSIADTARRGGDAAPPPAWAYEVLGISEEEHHSWATNGTNHLASVGNPTF